MSDTPKFEVIDRRKLKAEEEQESTQSAAKAPEPPAASKPGEPAPGPRLVVNEPKPEPPAEEPPAAHAETGLPPAPTAAESREQKAAYDASAQRLEDMIRAQNPTAGPQPPVEFGHLVQQLYLTAMLQMGAGTPEGQQARIDIVGARNTIDMLGVLAEKTRGNLSPAESHLLESALFEARMGFLELSTMVAMPKVPPPAPVK
jgi:hypothetical protein